jgi:hypothetical protein
MLAGISPSALTLVTVRSRIEPSALTSVSVSTMPAHLGLLIDAAAIEIAQDRDRLATDTRDRDRLILEQTRANAITQRHGCRVIGIADDLIALK